MVNTHHRLAGAVVDFEPLVERLVQVVERFAAPVDSSRQAVLHRHGLSFLSWNHFSDVD